MLRPDVVWFGEALPQDVWKNAIKEASTCDVMIIVGTSLGCFTSEYITSLRKTKWCNFD